MTRVTSSRLQISTPNATLRDEPADVPGDLKKIVDPIDANVAMYGQGLAVNRPAFGIAGRFYFATDQLVLYYDSGTAWTTCDGNMYTDSATFDALGVGIHNGMRVSVYFAGAGVDVLWDMIWDVDATPFKWRCAGATPHFSEVATAEASTNSAYVDLATVGPSVTIPFDGKYNIEFGAMITTDGIVTHGAFCAPVLGATPASDANSIEVLGPDTAESISVSRWLFSKTLNKADVVKLQYKQTVGGSSNFTRRWLRVIPVVINN